MSEGEAVQAVAQAREAGASAALLHDQDALAKFADPPAGDLALADVLFGRLLGAQVDDAEAAAALIGEMAALLHLQEIQKGPAYTFRSLFTRRLHENLTAR